MNRELIDKTVEYLKKTFEESEYIKEEPGIMDYRIEHSFRVANIAKTIAEKEGFNVTDMVIACLLHDIAYSRPFRDSKDWLDHGRNSARMIRPFLFELGLEEKRVNDICFAVAIHVDDKSDFEGEYTPFTRTVSDADNIDHFDALRIFENLAVSEFPDLDLEKKKAHLLDLLEKLKAYYSEELSTSTATQLWKDRVAFYYTYYERLLSQIEASGGVL